MNSYYNSSSPETYHFIDSLSTCWTRFSEDAVLKQELISLKSKFQGSNLEISPIQMKQYIIRSIFLEMLGYETSFIYIHAINLTQSKSYSLKKLGYLACCLFLNEASDVLIMLIATIQKDLKSGKSEYINIALSAISRLLCPDLIENIHPLLNNLLKHEKREIRLKTLMVLYQMYKYSPSLIGSFSIILKSFMSDKHVKTVFMVTNIMCDEVLKKPLEYIDVLEDMIKLLEGVFYNKLNKDQGFYKIKARILYTKNTLDIPPPWILIKMLDILEVLVGENKKNSEKMYRILSDMLKEYSNINSLATDSIVFQCMKTIFNIYPNENLIIRCCDTLSLYLNQQTEQKYMGIKTLLYLGDQNLKYINQYQDEIISCLENQDFMIKRKTLLLLIKIANLENIGIVIPKLLKYLQMENDEFFKKLLVSRIFELFKKYTPNPQFFLLFGSEFLKFGGVLVSDEIKNEFIRMIKSIYCSDQNKMGLVVSNFYKDLIIYEQNLPENLIQIACWILGEIGSEIYRNNIETLRKITKVIQEKFLINAYEKDTLRWLLNSLIKLNSVVKLEDFTFLKKFRASKDHDLAQRIEEFEKIGQNGDFLKESQTLSDIDEGLSFLNSYVNHFIAMGFKTYEKNRNLKDEKKDIKSDKNIVVENKIHFEGKKMWGNNMKVVNEENEKKNKTQDLMPKHRNYVKNTQETEKKTEDINKPETEKKTEVINKPVNLIQTPNEEFTSKFFKGILEETRNRKTKQIGISIGSSKNINISKSTNEELLDLTNHKMVENLNNLIKNQDIVNIEHLSEELTNEMKFDVDIISTEEIKKLADNFSLRAFIKENNLIDFLEFIIAGIKSNEIIICSGIETPEKHRIRFIFKSTSMPVLSNLISFIKEYFNKKGFKYY